MPNRPQDRYLRYAELTELLQSYAAEHPDLIQISSIGQSFEGREIWMATVTDFETGPPENKPGFWMDGNIHATEVSASSAVMKVLEEAVTTQRALLVDRVLYLVPRLNPDGAEWALADNPKHIRSSTRPYPYDEEDPYGLERMDIDGDGRILSMRVPDPSGAWKISEVEPRLMQRREPGETGGHYYRLLPEGLFHNFDGLTMRGRKIKEGLDLNRNFPGGWRPENEQYGAGPFPTSEPEVRAAVEAITQRPNICGGITFHTFSGVILRIPGRCPDDELPPEDVWTMKTLGKKGTELSGYPCISVFHDFKYHPKEVITGVFDDWLYDHLGIYGWTVEIWSPQKQAGIEDYKPIDWFREHPFEDDQKLLAWSDEKLDGQGYLPWTKFEHPQLGEVEIGGWDSQLAFRNPPPKFLESEIAPLVEWGLWMASTTPCLKLRDVQIEFMGGNARVRLAVQNAGYLPTCVTEQGKKKNVVRGVVGEVFRQGDDSSSQGREEPEWLIAGKIRQIGPQLKGWSHVPSATFGWGLDATEDLHVFEWVLETGHAYKIVAHHPRAGRIETEVDLSAQ
ncbi:MAG: M14 family metallopeptidase [Armatimonadetes bacterium]|nr:M14 family metallopeptidase [Armatimonadota bacterium]